MPSGERRKYAAKLKKSIEEEDIANWLLHLLEDAINLVQQRSEITT